MLIFPLLSTSIFVILYLFSQGKVKSKCTVSVLHDVLEICNRSAPSNFKMEVNVVIEMMSAVYRSGC